MNSPLTDCLLVVVGACLGTAVNWAIYRLALINPRRTSPWSRGRAAETRWSDFIPMVGWYLQRRDSPTWGRGFWIRPLLIELACAALLPFLFRSIQSGMLTTGANFAIPPTAPQTWVWAIFYFLLMALLIAATFIDFDEKTIPDEITFPGTLFALAAAYLLPTTRLPDIDVEPTGLQFAALQFASPGEIPAWSTGPAGPAATIVIAVIWMFALLPKTVTWRFGIRRGLQLMFASMLRTRSRRADSENELPILSMVSPVSAGVMGILLVGLTIAAWNFGGTAWHSLLGAWLGLGFGGGLVWAVRIIAGGALGKEAMGFGDVTLMAMIGAWLGWQPALLVFAIAPFAALLIAAFQWIVMRHTEIAFGPYLSLGAVIVVFFWGSLWHDWAKFGIFSLGPALLVIIAVCLLLMAGMLNGWRAIQSRSFGDES